MEKKQHNSNISFEKALLRLEEIVEELERGDILLEESLALYEEGIRLYRLCIERLNDFQGKIELLLKQADGTFFRKDFVPDDIGDD